MLWSFDSVSLPGRRLPRLDRMTLEIDEGTTAVLGQSGAGKTSLLNLLVGFERPAVGQIEFRGSTNLRSPNVFWAPPNQGLWPHLTVREHLLTVARQYRSESPDEADIVLDNFDLLACAQAKPNSLSMGERSRLNVARALFSQAEILVLDEPFAHVDEARCGRYWEVVRETCLSRQTSIVFSTHAPEVVLSEANQVICLTHGRLAYYGGVEALYVRPASPELAGLLGPYNWLTAADRICWLTGASDDALPDARQHVDCVRPEQLEIERADSGPLLVERSRFMGSTEETSLRHLETNNRRSFVHRPRGANRLSAGDRVVLNLLLLLVTICFAGCTNDSLPVLPVKHESDWMMPPDGPRVPAPRGMTVSPDHEYLVLDNAGRVLVFDEHGELKRRWWMPEYSVGKAEGICVLKDGRTAVADTHYHRIVFFDREGTVTGMFGQIGSEPGDFVYPVAITQDPEENLYVCEYGRNDRVQKFRPDGTFVLQFGGPGTERGQFQRPSGIVWYDHQLFVVDAFNNRIQVFSEEGKLLAILAESDKLAEVHYPYDIAVDAKGDLFVVEYGGGCVTKFSREGRPLGRYGKSGSGQKPAQFSTPWALTIDQRGRLYVCDTGNRRIVELEL